MSEAATSGADSLIVCGIAGSLRRGSYHRALLRGRNQRTNGARCCGKKI
jgi:hypothetical protein